jgi:hypothetical protein
LATEELRVKIATSREKTDSDRQELLKHVERLLTKDILIGEEKEMRHAEKVSNLHVSHCYNCSKNAVWVYDRLIFPSRKSGAQPNPDLPSDILPDFAEAREIVDASPRGAAALLRLCIQKLCGHLGEKGKNIDDDIASLVKKGLHPQIQKSLDIVRVIGNEAVHPGTMDLKDDRESELTVFDLVNSIVDQMISHPKTVQAMYAKLPESKRKAIEARDKT